MLCIFQALLASSLLLFAALPEAVLGVSVATDSRHLLTVDYQLRIFDKHDLAVRLVCDSFEDTTFVHYCDINEWISGVFSNPTLAAGGVVSNPGRADDFTLMHLPFTADSLGSSIGPAFIDFDKTSSELNSFALFACFSPYFCDQDSVRLAFDFSGSEFQIMANSVLSDYAPDGSTSISITSFEIVTLVTCPRLEPADHGAANACEAFGGGFEVPVTSPSGELTASVCVQFVDSVSGEEVDLGDNVDFQEDMSTVIDPMSGTPVDTFCGIFENVTVRFSSSDGVLASALGPFDDVNIDISIPCSVEIVGGLLTSLYVDLEGGTTMQLALCGTLSFGTSVDSTSSLPPVGRKRQLAPSFVVTSSGPGVPFTTLASVTGDPHLVGPHGERFDFRGQDNGVYVLFSAPHALVTMRMMNGGPKNHFIHELGVHLGNWTTALNTFRFDAPTLQRRLTRAVKPFGGSAVVTPYNVVLELCDGFSLAVQQRFIRMEAGGPTYFYLDVRMSVPGCHDALGGVLGDLYRCERWHQQSSGTLVEEKWTTEKEESYRVAELLQPATKLEKCSDFVLSEKAPKAASMTAPVHPTDERLTQGLAAKDADEQPPKEQEQPNSSIESAADTDAVVDRRASRPLRRRRHERVADVAETGSGVGNEF